VCGVGGFVSSLSSELPPPKACVVNQIGTTSAHRSGAANPANGITPSADTCVDICVNQDSAVHVRLSCRSPPTTIQRRLGAPTHHDVSRMHAARRAVYCARGGNSLAVPAAHLRPLQVCEQPCRPLAVQPHGNTEVRPPTHPLRTPLRTRVEVHSQRRGEADAVRGVQQHDVRPHLANALRTGDASAV
jgi:hypothetical protein